MIVAGGNMAISLVLLIQEFDENVAPEVNRARSTPVYKDWMNILACVVGKGRWRLL